MKGFGAIISAGVVTIAAGCGLPGGPGDFNRPAKAASMQSSFVRYYEECRDATLDTGLGVHGCPLSAPSSYDFGPDGACTVKATGLRAESCDSTNGNECNDVRLEVSCSDIRDSNGLPVSSEGWKLAAKYRATMATIGGDMTIVDALVSLDLASSNGSITLSDTPVNAFIARAHGLGAAGYMGPLNVLIVEAKIVDPDSKTFAVMGFAAN
jgi:hypothetical protein